MRRPITWAQMRPVETPDPSEDDGVMRLPVLACIGLIVVMSYALWLLIFDAAAWLLGLGA